MPQIDRSPRLVRVPMAANSRQHVKLNVVNNSETTCGVSGDPRRFGVNEARNIKEAEELIESTSAGRIVTGRNRNSRFTGA